MRAFLKTTLIALVAALAAAPGPALAWPSSPFANAPVFVFSPELLSSNWFRRSVAPDGARGVVVLVVLGNGDGTSTMRPQRLDRHGNVLWGPYGGGVLTSRFAQVHYGDVVGDGAGGVFAVWADRRNGTNYDVFAQHIVANGARAWPDTGAAVCVMGNEQWFAQVAADGAGGIVVVWRDGRNGTSDQVYAQRLDASGAALWSANGVAVCPAAGDQTLPLVIGDGQGGTIVGWEDTRGGAAALYAQRLDSDGNGVWAASGVEAAPGGAYAGWAWPVADGAGGLIACWTDVRTAPDSANVYAQRVDASGAPRWGSGGTAVCTDPAAQTHALVVSDGAGGAIVAWDDLRGVSSRNTYVQRVDSLGLPVWAADGVPVCTNPALRWSARIVADGAGGAIVSWVDDRNPSQDIYAQRFDADGNYLWDAPGVAVCLAGQWQQDPQLVSDESGGAIVVWQDARNFTFYDFYAQEVNADGVLGDPVAVLISGFDAAWRDGAVALRWRLATDEDLLGYRVYRREDGTGRDAPLTASLLPIDRREYVDDTAARGSAYVYTLAAVRADGSEVRSIPARVAVPGYALSLAPARPNPFYPATEIAFTLDRDGPASLAVYDVSGRRVRTLVRGARRAGDYVEAWDGRDGAGRRVAAGVYFVRLEAHGRALTRKALLLR